MSYELNLEQYQGPLQKLLELIEEKKMEIMVVSLAEVTGGFFDYLKKLEKAGVSHSILADFFGSGLETYSYKIQSTFTFAPSYRRRRIGYTGLRRPAQNLSGIQKSPASRQRTLESFAPNVFAGIFNDEGSDVLSAQIRDRRNARESLPGWLANSKNS